jgi:streptogramin lyase
MAVAPPAGAQVGTVTEIPLGSGSDPYGIAVGGDGNLWFTTLSAGYIGRVTPAGTPTQFSASISPGSPLRGIVAGPDSKDVFDHEPPSAIRSRTSVLGVDGSGHRRR